MAHLQCKGSGASQAPSWKGSHARPPPVLPLPLAALERVALRGCRHVTTAGIYVLLQRPSLKRVVISKCPQISLESSADLKVPRGAWAGGMHGCIQPWPCAGQSMIRLLSMLAWRANMRAAPLAFLARRSSTSPLADPRQPPQPTRRWQLPGFCRRWVLRQAWQARTCSC